MHLRIWREKTAPGSLVRSDDGPLGDERSVTKTARQAGEWNALGSIA
jgi:hypothetical protein